MCISIEPITHPSAVSLAYEQQLDSKLYTPPHMFSPKAFISTF